MYRLTDQATEVLKLDGAGVSLADTDGRLQFVSATDERVVRIEEQQILTGQGPCQDAFASGQKVVCADLNSEDRWPDYRGEALTEGCQAVAGIPMFAHDTGIGALNIYKNQPRVWSAEDLQVAQVLAQMATGYVKNLRLLTESQQMSTQLTHALQSRIIIEQAKGVIAEREAITPHDAFERIRHHSRGRQLRVHDVARAVVERVLRL